MPNDRGSGGYKGGSGGRPNPSGGPRESEAVRLIKEQAEQLKHFDEYPVDKMVDHALKLATELSLNLTKTQMRKVYGFVRRMEARGELNEREVSAQALLLKPKLAYTSARDPASKPIYEAWDPCLNIVKTPGDMRAFSQFAESIVAYFESMARRN